MGHPNFRGESIPKISVHAGLFVRDSSLISTIIQGLVGCFVDLWVVVGVDYIDEVLLGAGIGRCFRKEILMGEVVS